MNIIDLNQKLFDTLEKIESGEMEIKKAQAIVNISNAINNNAKLMISAAKIAKNPTISNKLFGRTSEEKDTPKLIGDAYQQKLEFSKYHGFENTAEAINHFGSSSKFNESFNEWKDKL